MLVMSMLACLSAFGIASAGAVVNLDGFCAASPQPRMRAMGVRECDFKKVSDTSSTAEAPSESGDALGAVTVPEPLVIKAGFIDWSFSIFRGAWGFSSRETTVGAPLPRAGGMATGAISGAKRPFWEAFWAFWMDRTA